MHNEIREYNTCIMCGDTYAHMQKPNKAIKLRVQTDVAVARTTRMKSNAETQ